MVVCLFTWLLIGVAAYILLGFVNDAQQTLDAITFSVSATGMLLMIKRYQSQFVFWLLGNIFSILLWFRAGCTLVVIMRYLLCIVCILLTQFLVCLIG